MLTSPLTAAVLSKIHCPRSRSVRIRPRSLSEARPEKPNTRPDPGEASPDIRIESPKDRLVFATVDPEAYKRIRGVALIHDEATVNGFLVRVGGATEKKCSLRVHGRDRLLYCDVASKELSRQLGRHLYEPVTVHGRGLYFSRTWELLRLRITRATFSPTSDYDQMIAEMRELGCDAWDDVEDVDEEIRTMR